MTYSIGKIEQVVIDGKTYWKISKDPNEELGKDKGKDLGTEIDKQEGITFFGKRKISKLDKD